MYDKEVEEELSDNCIFHKRLNKFIIVISFVLPRKFIFLLSNWYQGKEEMANGMMSFIIPCLIKENFKN